MRKSSGARILVAALALLLLGSATGLVSGQHTHSIRVLVTSAAPEIRSTEQYGEGRAAGEAHRCCACVLSAQLSALSLPGVLALLPPQSVGAIGIDEPSLFVGTALPTRSARAPPLASSESHAV